MEALAQIVVTDTSTSSISFTGIPATYGSLYINGQVSSTSTNSIVDIYGRMNNVSSFDYNQGGRWNYATSGSYNTNSMSSSSSASSIILGKMNGTPESYGSQLNNYKVATTFFELNVTQYKASDNGAPAMWMESSFLIDSDSGSGAYYSSNFWGIGCLQGSNNTDMTSVQLIPEAGNWSEGSFFTLYGRPLS